MSSIDSVFGDLGVIRRFFPTFSDGLYRGLAETGSPHIEMLSFSLLRQDIEAMIDSLEEDSRNLDCFHRAARVQGLVAVIAALLRSIRVFDRSADARLVVLGNTVLLPASFRQWCDEILQGSPEAGIFPLSAEQESQFKLQILFAVSSILYFARDVEELRIGVPIYSLLHNRVCHRRSLDEQLELVRAVVRRIPDTVEELMELKAIESNIAAMAKEQSYCDLFTLGFIFS